MGSSDESSAASTEITQSTRQKKQAILKKVFANKTKCSNRGEKSWEYEDMKRKTCKGKKKTGDKMEGVTIRKLRKRRSCRSKNSKLTKELSATCNEGQNW